MAADLFINICIVVTLVFLYMKLRWRSAYEDAYSLKGVLIDGLSGGLMGYILMIFSIQVTDETILDLRYVPIMLLILFVGKTPASISSVLIISSRFLISVNRSAVYSIFMILILFIGYSIIEKLLAHHGDLMTKALTLTFFSNAVVTYFLAVLVADLSVVGPLAVTYWLISTLGGVSAIFLVDYLKKSEYLFSKYETESSRDFLTGLYNVRRFDELWLMTSEKVKRTQGSLALLMLDIDHFKSINDTYGHASGDSVLIEMSRIIEAAVGNEGTVFRKGGEEFTVILNGYDRSGALSLAERIRQSVEDTAFSLSEETTIRMTISIGAAVYPETINETKGMIEKADAALYESKNAGRNRVSF
ncbi:GGDEF domain-containing protein [Alkalibacterium pelagium]|jgi:diguanylate cyclase|uniref:Diguanylate cyclase n=1 Tax=Alkalibacterium pelagium TaxID=426702 RepID=A0A1H7NXL1_9LACT|nr:GGDEF domain-containing protein [Alkalibacterium pelagium]GEN51487.1 GGDEF domain-containing protein [Alkalibacterium pelagium]SEL27745.1 diguanylate cyclase [Alkalibacterium pelagium]